MEQKSQRRNNQREIMEENSRRRSPESDSMEEKSGTRDHGGEVLDTSCKNRGWEIVEEK